jgi:hypothetical protein
MHLYLSSLTWYLELEQRDFVQSEVGNRCEIKIKAMQTGNPFKRIAHVEPYQQNKMCKVKQDDQRSSEEIDLNIQRKHWT